jgi:hypothetical protein
MSEVCQELQNIKYQTMLLNHNSKIYENKPKVDDIELFLQKEKASNKEKPWSKLSKASKLIKINEYAKIYSKDKNLNDEQVKELLIYLKRCLDRKKLQRQKDVTYDMETNKIKTINGLFYNKTSNKFTLKIKDKKTNTLKCLAPHKKRRKTKTKIDKSKKMDKIKIEKSKIDKTKIEKSKIDKTKIDKTKIRKTKIDKTKIDKIKKKRVKKKNKIDTNLKE